MSALYFRVQDMQGKGPFWRYRDLRWADTLGEHFPPSLHQEFQIDQLYGLRSERHTGCAVRTLEGLRPWFTPTECERLAGHDFYIAAMDGRVLAESEHQLLIARDRPFNHDCRVIPWKALSLACVGA